IDAVNTGSASARLGDDALTLELRVPPGSMSNITGLGGFTGFETLCDDLRAGAPRACSLRRANLLRLKTRSWPPGASARANIAFATITPKTIPAHFNIQADDGRTWIKNQEIVIEKEPIQ